MIDLNFKPFYFIFFLFIEYKDPKVFKKKNYYHYLNDKLFLKLFLIKVSSVGINFN